MNPLAILGIKALAIIAAVGALLWGIHTLDQSRQQIGYDRRVGEDNVALLKAQTEARDKERELNQRLETAQNEATIREQDIKRTAAAAATAGDRLRLALDAIRDRVPRNSGTPGSDPTSTLAELFGDCSNRYRGVAEKADRHSSDTRTLIEAWPK